MSDDKRELALGFVALALFVVLRTVLLFVREPFYDELFTQWIVRLSYGEIVEALRVDSGPPLYYWLLKTCGVTSVQGARFVSLLCATLAAAILVFAGRLGRARFLAVLLLAVYPPSVLLSVDARAYTLCALFVTVGLVAIRYERPYLAACAFALAGYSHYYGVLFFAALPRLRPAALAVALFIPGFLLAHGQSREAMGWLAPERHNPLLAISFAGAYPEALFEPSPWPLIALALALLVAAVWREWRAARYVAVPLAQAVVFALIGTPVYFPMRFESVLAVPLMLWICTRVRPVLIAALALVGAYASLAGIADHARRPDDHYRVAALALRENVRPNDDVVATGYLYLESAAALGDRVRAFPAEQARHPGWRARVDQATLRNEARALPPRFLWIGERAAPELRVLCEKRACRPLYANARALVLDVR